MLTLFNSISNMFSHFSRSMFQGLLPVVQFFQAHYLRRKFLIKTKYADRPVLVRGKTSDPSVFFEVFILKIYKIPETEVATIVDIGANVGYASIYFSHFFPNAHIIAVEPEQSNHQMLIENTQNYQNIDRVHAAIWHEERELALQNPHGSNWSFHYNEDTRAGSPIKAQTVPGLMDKFNLKRINLLKIDIEGGEKTLFASNTDWLRYVDCLLIEIHSGEAKKTVFNALSKYTHSHVNVFNNYCIQLSH